MPTIPALPPGMMAQAASGGPTSPANFLMAAADMHRSGQLADQPRSAPMPKGKSLPVLSSRGPRHPRPLRVLK